MYYRVLNQMLLGKSVSSDMSRKIFREDWKDWKEGPYKAIQLANPEYYKNKAVYFLYLITIINISVLI